MGLFSMFKSGTSTRNNYQVLIEKGALVIDVRTAQEFNAGHVPGSKNIPLHLLNEQKKAFKGKEIILVCRSGARAEQAKQVLSRSGFIAHNAGSWRSLI